MKNRHSDFVHWKSFLIIFSLFGLVVFFQNCAPMGDIDSLASASKNSETPDSDSTSEDQTPTNTEDSTPTNTGNGVIDPCLGNKSPELFGELLPNKTTQSSIDDRQAHIGIELGAGTTLPSDIRIHASPGPGETQILSLRCTVSPSGGCRY